MEWLIDRLIKKHPKLYITGVVVMALYGAFGMLYFVRDTIELLAPVLSNYGELFRSPKLILAIAIAVICGAVIFAVRAYRVLNKKTQTIPNKQALILAIAEFELQAHRSYEGQFDRMADYGKACADLLRQVRILGIASDNPVTDLYNLRSAVDFKLGNINEGAMVFDHDWQFVSALRNATGKARQWVEMANQQEFRKEGSQS